jgi:class I fructose-bisphosphate aldolase
MAKGTIGGKEFAPHDPEAIRMVARMGSEIGADLIKTYYTGSVESFARVVEGCPVPIVILGGSKTDSVRDVFQTIHDSLHAGGSGIAMGRNIWSFRKVEAILEAINGLVHGHWGVDKALAKVEA